MSAIAYMNIAGMRTFSAPAVHYLNARSDPKCWLRAKLLDKLGGT